MKKIPPCRAAQRLQGYRATGGERTRVHVCVYVRTFSDWTDRKRKEWFKFSYCTPYLCLCSLRGCCKLYRLLFCQLKNFVRSAKEGRVRKINSENLALLVYIVWGMRM